MKSYLICCAIAASAVWHAGASAQDPPKLAAAAQPPTAPQVKASPRNAPTRHLSDEERAELRRQLQQFNRQYSTKRS